MRAFLTGSHAYGTPHEKSDVDLVVWLEPEALKILFDLAEAKTGSGTEQGRELGAGASLRFGRLNLICPPTEKHVEVWRKKTAELAARKPVTRDEAVATIKAGLGKANE